MRDVIKIRLYIFKDYFVSYAAIFCGLMPVYFINHQDIEFKPCGKHWYEMSFNGDRMQVEIIRVLKLRLSTGVGRGYP